MANGDDYNPLDPNPPGTMTGLGIGPNDPLNDWASNTKPSDLQRFVHDPEGAVQGLIDQGKPPPDHHYISDPNGNLTPATADHAALMDAAKQKLTEALNQQRGQQPETPLIAPPTASATRSAAPIPDPSQGNITRPLGFSTEPPPRPEDTAGTPSQRRPIPPTQTIPPSGPLAGPTPALGEPSGPLAPVGKWIRDKFGNTVPAPTTEVPPEGEPLPKVAPRMPAPRPKTIPPAGYDLEPEAVPAARPEVKPDVKMQKEKKKGGEDEDEDVKPFSSKAMEGFSKSLAGVKVPTRPPLPAPGTPSVRSPVGINPSLAALLTSAGAHGPPTAAPNPLIRLIRGGY